MVRVVCVICSFRLRIRRVATSPFERHKRGRSGRLLLFTEYSIYANNPEPQILDLISDHLSLTALVDSYRSGLLFLRRNVEELSATSIGGQWRRDRGPRHLSADFLSAERCGSRMTIVYGNGRRGYVKYGCSSHRNRGTCANSVMIRKDRLEDRLLTQLTDRILQPAMVDYALQGFQEQLRRRLTGSNRRRRPFQGLLLIALSRLESADTSERKQFRPAQKLG
jgi:hypothetical protein